VQSDDQRSFDRASHLVAWAGNGELSVLCDYLHGAPTLVARAAIDAHAHTVGVDATKLQAWVVRAAASGGRIEPFSMHPERRDASLSASRMRRAASVAGVPGVRA